MNYHLRLEGLTLRAHIGCGEEERSLKQEVRVSVEIGFARPPLVCQSDRIEDGICYAELARQIALLVAENSFHTIEHLAHACYESLRGLISSGERLKLEVHKVHPPLEQFSDGVFFSIGDGS